MLAAAHLALLLLAEKVARRLLLLVLLLLQVARLDKTQLERRLAASAGRLVCVRRTS